MADAAPAIPTPAPAATPAADPFDADQTAHLGDVFGFDDGSNDTPRDPGEGDKSSSVGAEGGEEGASLEGPVPSEPPAGEAPAEPPVVDEKDLELASLRARVEELSKPKEEAPAPAPTEPKPGEAPAVDAPPAIDFKLPDQFKEAILSEDPAENIKAIEGIVTGITNHFNARIYELQQALATVKADKASAVTVDAPAVAAEASAAVERMQEDYYKDFPQHKKPEYLPILQAVAGEMAQQFPGHPWDEKYRAALGQRVTARAKQLAALVNPQAGTPPLLQPGAREAVPGVGSGDISDEIMDTLGFG